MRNRSARFTVLLLALNALGTLLAACGTIPSPISQTTPVVAPPTATLPLDPTAPVSPDPTVPGTTPTAGPGCLDQASFVADVTVPDGTVVAPGSFFVKTWRLRNSGTCAWTTDYALVFDRGDALGGAASIPLPQRVEVGSTVDLSVTLTAPISSGDYRGRWQLRNAIGQRFGIVESGDGTFVVRITVPAAPAPSPTPVVPPTVPVITEWKGEYFDTLDLGLTRLPVLVRNDGQIDFRWGDGAPAAGLPADGFSVRWTRRLTFDEATYRFTLRVDDGAILYIDDRIVIDTWKDGRLREVSAEYGLPGGEHDVRVEYYDRSGNAEVRFWYEKAGAYLPDWKGEYFSNAELAGAPVLVQNEGQVDFDWGLGSAAAGLPLDRWSARWSRWVTFPAGTYTLYAQADNGIRVYLDGRLLIDGWFSNGQDVYSVAVPLEGPHRLVVEYYENEGAALARFWWK